MGAPNGVSGGSEPSQINNTNPLFSNAELSNAAFKPAVQHLNNTADAPITNGQSAAPTGDTNAAAFLAGRTAAKSNANPLPISALRTGFCYDIRMRFHQTVDYRDTHPEENLQGTCTSGINPGS